MAIIIRSYEMATIKNLSQPIIYCHPDQIFVYEAISLNISLAKKLSAIKEKRRTMRLEQCFRQALEGLPDNPVIRDFDVLFNPVYEVDVLQILASVGKSRPFQVVWPGFYEEGRLIYAEEGYPDYKVYDLDKYDVTCII